MERTIEFEPRAHAPVRRARRADGLAAHASPQRTRSRLVLSTCSMRRRCSARWITGMSVRPHDGGDDGKVGPTMGYGDLRSYGKLCGLLFDILEVGFHDEHEGSRVRRGNARYV